MEANATHVALFTMSTISEELVPAKPSVEPIEDSEPPSGLDPQLHRLLRYIERKVTLASRREITNLTTKKMTDDMIAAITNYRTVMGERYDKVNKDVQQALLIVVDTSLDIAFGASNGMDRYANLKNAALTDSIAQPFVKVQKNVETIVENEDKILAATEANGDRITQMFEVMTELLKETKEQKEEIKSMKTEIVELREESKDQKEEIISLKTEIVELKQLNALNQTQTTAPTVVLQRRDTYAAMAAKLREKPVVNDQPMVVNDYPVIVKSSVAGDTAEQIENWIKNVVKPMENGITITSSRLNKKDGKVVLGFADKQSSDKFKTMTDNTKYSWNDPKKREPEVRFCAPNEFEDKEEEMIEIIRSNNKEIRDLFPTVEAFKKEFAIKRREPKNKRFKGFVARVSPRVRDTLVNLPHGIRFDIECVRVKDYLKPLQCFKCWQFGHAATKEALRQHKEGYLSHKESGLLTLRRRT